MAIKILTTAQELGYKKMRLDTLESLKPAVKLYLSLGFHKIEPYYSNPLDGVIYMEKLLS